jgi:galactose mutarotase-like enzyme
VTALRLRAGSVSASVDAEHGGLLASLDVDGQELLLAGSSESGRIPHHGSFLLAPWVGELSGGRLPFRGREHRLPTGPGRHAVHGTVYAGPWDVEQWSERYLSLRRDLTEPWPFAGSVRQTFELDEGGLRQTARLTAEGEAMPVSLGWHPWFRIQDPDAVAVRVDASRCLELDRELIPTGAIMDVSGDEDLRAGPILGARRIDVVYIDVPSPARLTLPGRVLDIDFDPRISIVVVYVTDGSVCIEPWTSWPDAPNASERAHATGLVTLEAGESLERWMSWRWSTA